MGSPDDYVTTLEAASGGALTASDLSSIGGEDVLVEASGANSLLSLPNLTTITADTTQSGSRTEVLASQGGDVEMPSLDQVGGGPSLLQSDGTGSTLDIASLPTIADSANQDYVPTLLASNGGSITATDLSTVNGADVEGRRGRRGFRCRP